VGGEEPGLTLRIATFNVQHGRRPDGVVEVGALGRAVAGFAADVVGLQEVDVGAARSGRADIPAEVAAASGLVPVFGESLVQRDGGRYGNALFVAGSVDDVEVVGLPGRPSGARAERRTVLVARADVAGATVSVGVCHLGLDGAESRLQLAAALEAVGGRPGPRILMGDWNLSRRHAVPIVAAAGFELAPADPTFPVDRPWRRIDHVAVDGLHVVGSEIRQEPVSDHRALLVDLRW
jgi:endonuclease/exonuclease/phosphatase family metal-dependent hydrolase